MRRKKPYFRGSAVLHMLEHGKTDQLQIIVGCERDTFYFFIFKVFDGLMWLTILT
jgi:hypothetical protein